MCEREREGEHEKDVSLHTHTSVTMWAAHHHLTGVYRDCGGQKTPNSLLFLSLLPFTRAHTHTHSLISFPSHKLSHTVSFSNTRTQTELASLTYYTHRQ